MEIILNTGKYHQIDDADIIKWVSLYPAIDVHQELNKMIAWCDANKSKRKTAKGVSRFIVNWLSRAQDKGGSGNPAQYNNQPMTNASDLQTDLSWVPEGELKEQTKALFISKYGFYSIAGQRVTAAPKMIAN